MDVGCAACCIYYSRDRAVEGNVEALESKHCSSFWASYSWCCHVVWNSSLQSQSWHLGGGIRAAHDFADFQLAMAGAQGARVRHMPRGVLQQGPYPAARMFAPFPCKMHRQVVAKIYQ